MQELSFITLAKQAKNSPILSSLITIQAVRHTAWAQQVFRLLKIYLCEKGFRRDRFINKRAR